MRLFLGFLSVFMVLVAVQPVMAQSEPKHEKPLGQRIDSWWKRMTAPNAGKVYSKPEYDLHDYQWGDDDWTPQAWVSDRGSAEAVMNDFYAAGIITEPFDLQRAIDGEYRPVLEVGQPFLNLSYQDQRRIAVFVDDVFAVTGRTGQGYNIVVDDWYRSLYAEYDQDGLHLM